jgi:hypothetical protein
VTADAGDRSRERGTSRMRPRAASWLAWSLASFSVAMFLASIALDVLARSVPVPSSLGASRTIIDLLTSVPILAFPVVGALIVSRRPYNPIGWICLAEGFLWMFLGVIDYYGVYGLAKPGTVPFPVVIYALAQWLWVPTVGLLAIYLPLLFPDGRLPSRRWRPLAWLSGAVIVVVSIAQGLIPGPLPGLGGVRNPFGLEGQPWVADAANAILVPFLLCILASVLSLILRYRRSGGEVRQQIKWIAFAASILGLLFVSAMASSLILFFFAPETWEGAVDTPPFWLELLFYVMVLSLAGVPVAVGFAVLKYRLYNIDLLINRTLVYGSLTATLALVYFGGVATIQTLFRALTGQEEQPQLAIVVSTLVIAALFNPLRRYIQSFIDRRFYRRKYDARKTLEAFSAKLRDETDLDALSDDLLAVVRETMQPAHVSLWLRPDAALNRERLTE